MPNCDACYGEKTADCPDDCLTSHVRYVDAYWNAKDAFEHDIKELYGQFISPEEFDKKWRPKLKIGNCWVCGSDNIRQNPDRRPVGESKYICLACGNHMGTIKKDSEFKEKDE